jgi:nucleotide-binding universal stress UspA family protein
MTTRKILWPVDMTENSLKISDYVADMAKKFDATIILLYVGLDLKANFPAYGNYPHPEHYKNFQEWEVRVTRERLDALCQQKLGGCPGIEVRMELGNPAEKILEVADREQVDTIIMATNGFDPNAAAANIFGSVSQQVIRDAKVPIYVINPRTCNYREEPLQDNSPVAEGPRG